MPDSVGNQSNLAGKCLPSEDKDFPSVCINGIDYQMFTGDPSFLKEGEAQLAPAMATYCLSFIAGLIGNLMVVCAVLQTNIRRSATNIYLLSLAISDAVFLLVCVPYKLANDFVNGWGFGSSLCKIFAYVELVTTVAAIYNLVAVSFERYIAISHPMKARYVVTIGNAKRLITVICVFSFLTGIPLLHFTKVEILRYFVNQTQELHVTHLCNQPDLTDDERLYFAIYRMTLMLAVPGILISFCYSRVILALRRSTKVINPSQIHMQKSRHVRVSTTEYSENRLGLRNGTATDGAASASTSNVRFKRRPSLCIHESRQQVIKMLIMIVLVFFLSWAPKLTFELLKVADMALFTNEALWLTTLCDLLPYVQCCINPYIYCFMSANFRHYIKHAVTSSQRLCCYSDKKRSRNGEFPSMSLPSGESCKLSTTARVWQTDARFPANRRTFKQPNDDPDHNAVAVTNPLLDSANSQLNTPMKPISNNVDVADDEAISVLADSDTHTHAHPQAPSADVQQQQQPSTEAQTHAAAVTDAALEYQDELTRTDGSTASSESHRLAASDSSDATISL